MSATPDEILAEVRKLILAYAGNDPDKWFYANRFVFARLMLDERKTKAGVKKFMFDTNASCHGCGKPFDTRSGVHLHRVDGARGYSKSNCVLMHAECHIQFHAKAEASRSVDKTSDSDSIANGVVSKGSMRYKNKSFLYWWDVAPGLHSRLGALAAIEFVKKDTNEKCLVDAKILQAALTTKRQTKRGQGNWGVRVLPGREEELAIESSEPATQWHVIPVTWLNEEDD